LSRIKLADGTYSSRIDENNNADLLTPELVIPHIQKMIEEARERGHGAIEIYAEELFGAVGAPSAKNLENIWRKKKIWETLKQWPSNSV